MVTAGAWARCFVIFAQPHPLAPASASASTTTRGNDGLLGIICAQTEDGRGLLLLLPARL